MKNKFKILDCTFRDGGYYTNWDFPQNITEIYFKSFNNLPVEYLEIGYRSIIQKTYHGEFFYCPSSFINNISKLTNKKLVIILNEKDLSQNCIDSLLKPCISTITMVRIAVDPAKIKTAIYYASIIKNMGFEVALNVMYMSKWKQYPDFFNELSALDDVIDYFYMVDSYGGVMPNEIIETIEIIRAKTNVKIGFHGHNNLELALINSITAIENGVEIIDSTILGMGRGAGNLKTELLLTYLNAKFGLDVNFNNLSELVSSFDELHLNYGWGTNLPYMVSGANSLPQKEVMDWVGKRYISINSIIRALEIKKYEIEDNVRFPLVNFKKKYKYVFIIGGGKSAIDTSDYITQYINLLDHTDVAIIHSSSRNSMKYANIKVDQFYCIVGNEGNRLEKVYDNFSNFSGLCIVPPFPRKMGTFVPDILLKSTYELIKIDFISTQDISHTSLALQIAYEVGLDHYYMVGFDGYYNDGIRTREQELFIENDNLFFEAKSKGIILTSLTATKYKNLNQDSIYAKV